MRLFLIMALAASGSVVLQGGNSQLAYVPCQGAWVMAPTLTLQCSEDSWCDTDCRLVEYDFGPNWKRYWCSCSEGDDGELAPPCSRAIDWTNVGVLKVCLHNTCSSGCDPDSDCVCPH